MNWQPRRRLISNIYVTVPNQIPTIQDESYIYIDTHIRAVKCLCITYLHVCVYFQMWAADGSTLRPRRTYYHDDRFLSTEQQTSKTIDVLCKQFSKTVVIKQQCILLRAVQMWKDKTRVKSSDARLQSRLPISRTSSSTFHKDV